MRRLLSILLLFCLGLGPALEAVPAHALASGWTGKADESSIPACCRRNGKHHCMMAAPAGETILTSSECCPCLPHAAATRLSSDSFSIAEEAVLLPAAESRAARGKDPDCALIAEERLQSQRGPPASLRD